MSVFADGFRSASRTRRYARLRRAQGSTTLRGALLSALALWGVPAIAPGLALLAVAMGRESGFVGVGLALGVTLFLAHLVGRPRLQAFDLLHQPSRRGIVMGHVIHRLPCLLWAGLMSGAAWLFLVPWLPEVLGGACALGAVVLAPLAIAVHAGAGRVAARADRGETASILPFLLPVVGYEVARLWLDSAPWHWVLAGAGAVLGIAIVVRTGDVIATLRKTLALLLVGAVAAMPAKPGDLPFTEDSAAWIAVGVAMAVTCLLLLVLALRSQLRNVDVAQVLETRSDADESRSPTRGRAAGPLRHERAGKGLWSARLRYQADAWLPEDHADRGPFERVGAWGGSSLILLVTVLRGPILAALAVEYATQSGVLLWLAVLAACFAGRVTAVDTTELQPRLWLLGVDYREQVLHGLRSLLLFAALPTLAAAAATLAITGASDPGRQAAVLAIGGAFVLRAGLPGLWPLQETHRMRLVLVWGALLVGLVVLGFTTGVWRWPALDALQATGIAGAVGLVLLFVRLLRLREPHVAACVRRSAEP